LCGSLHRRLSAEVGDALFILVCGIEGGPHRPGCNGIDANSPADQVGGERAREGVDAALGHRVVQQMLAPQQSRNRAAIYDGASIRHVRYRSFRHVEVAVEVGLQRLVEMFVGQFVERVDVFLKPGVVDENVEAAERLYPTRQRGRWCC
jgi:hypothetical protein